MTPVKKFVIDIQELRIAVDIVVISKQEDSDYVLLMKRKYQPYANQWAIPGGFVKNDEVLSQAALRELHEETGLSNMANPILIGIFDEVNRDPRKRVISVSYLVITDQLVTLNPDTQSEDNDSVGAKWVKVTEVEKPLAFDHDQILDAALKKYKEIA